jgi:hypothetical protein
VQGLWHRYSEGAYSYRRLKSILLYFEPQSGLASQAASEMRCVHCVTQALLVLIRISQSKLVQMTSPAEPSSTTGWNRCQSSLDACIIPSNMATTRKDRLDLQPAHLICLHLSHFLQSRALPYSLSDPSHTPGGNARACVSTIHRSRQSDLPLSKRQGRADGTYFGTEPDSVDIEGVEDVGPTDAVGRGAGLEVAGRGGMGALAFGCRGGAAHCMSRMPHGVRGDIDGSDRSLTDLAVRSSRVRLEIVGHQYCSITESELEKSVRMRISSLKAVMQSNPFTVVTGKIR